MADQTPDEAKLAEALRLLIDLGPDGLKAALERLEGRPELEPLVDRVQDLEDIVAGATQVIEVPTLEVGTAVHAPAVHHVVNIDDTVGITDEIGVSLIPGDDRILEAVLVVGTALLGYGWVTVTIIAEGVAAGSSHVLEVLFKLAVAMLWKQAGGQ